LAGHTATFLGAFAAGGGTLPTMIHVVPFAFLCTGIANLCASGAERVREVTVATHESGCGSADLGAIEIELDAMRQ
jgi:hypothetical protein